ncbi:hypothetical protein CHS0354_011492 [Potamilus streckersoni]|uniref:BHLH domain-containing protein n=1 Tax=Potamilus streckersoni TaxID=2493646 RepID=A0AAE0SLE8_9BIVA|nr:hypothetical protein CHS0354_011492 [Potamilus streckersoni]
MPSKTKLQQQRSEYVGVCPSEEVFFTNGESDSPDEVFDPLDTDETSVPITAQTSPPAKKCGRPANPIPRHKRESHIKAEYKRRDKIQKGFDTLKSLVPELKESSNCKESKASMLFKTAHHVVRLKADCARQQNEISALRHELEVLGNETHCLQNNLPENGLVKVESPPCKMDTLYQDYIKTQTEKNWKFWIFTFFIRPLYKSYRTAMATSSTMADFTHAVQNWTRENLTLVNLRPGFLSALRKISTQTSIMTCPQKLQEEAMLNCVDPHVVPEPDDPINPVTFSTPTSPRKAQVTPANSEQQLATKIGSSPPVSAVPSPGRSASPLVQSSVMPKMISQVTKAAGHPTINSLPVIHVGLDVDSHDSSIPIEMPSFDDHTFSTLVECFISSSTQSSSSAPGSYMQIENQELPTSKLHDNQMMVSSYPSACYSQVLMGSQVFSVASCTTHSCTPSAIDIKDFKPENIVTTTITNTQFPMAVDQPGSEESINEIDYLLSELYTKPSVIPNTVCHHEHSESMELEEISLDGVTPTVFTTAQPTIISPHHTAHFPPHNTFPAGSGFITTHNGYERKPNVSSLLMQILGDDSHNSDSASPYPFSTPISKCKLTNS